MIGTFVDSSGAHQEVDSRLLQKLAPFFNGPPLLRRQSEAMLHRCLPCGPKSGFVLLLGWLDKFPGHDIRKPRT